MQVVRRELFCLLRQRHGSGFDTFVTERVVVLAGDVTCESFGIEAKKLRELRLTDELNIIVNSAATTNFYERYHPQNVTTYAR